MPGVIARITIVTLMLVSGLIAISATDAVLLSPIRVADGQLAELSAELTAARGRRSDVQQSLADLRSRKTDETSYFIMSKDSATTIATIQEELRAAVLAVGGQLVSSQGGIGNAADATAARVQILLRARLSEAGLFEFVRQIEQRSPPIFIQSFEIAPSAAALGQGATLDFSGVLVAFHADAS